MSLKQFQVLWQPQLVVTRFLPRVGLLKSCHVSHTVIAAKVILPFRTSMCADSGSPHLIKTRFKLGIF